MPDPMKRHRILATVATLVLAACTAATPDTRRDSVAVPSAPMVAAAEPASDSADEDSDDDCGLLPVSLNPDPIALVRHYVELDKAGHFLETTPYTDSLYLCPNHLSGPDAFTVISGSDVQPMKASDSVAQVLVRSQRIGEIAQDSAGFAFTRNPGTELDTFVVRRTAFGWRIESPELPDRVLASSVLAKPDRFHLRSAVRDSLRASVSRRAH